MFTYFALILDKRNTKYIYGFALGGIIMVCTMGFGPLTGACITPIKIIGPMILYYDV